MTLLFVDRLKEIYLSGVAIELQLLHNICTEQFQQSLESFPHLQSDHVSFFPQKRQYILLPVKTLIEQALNPSLTLTSSQPQALQKIPPHVACGNIVPNINVPYNIHFCLLMCLTK